MKKATWKMVEQECHMGFWVGYSDSGRRCMMDNNGWIQAYRADDALWILRNHF